jgi:ribose-phosphate pyrophosphokinase
MSAIVAGPASKELAYNLAKVKGTKYIDVDVKRFPDGEVKITIPEVEYLEEKDIILVQSTHPPVNEHLIQLLFILGKIKKHAKSIILVTPYLAYARQDREFLKGESVSINHISSILDLFNILRFITIDIHSRLALSYIKNSINLTAIPLLANRFKGLDNVIVISPDLGGRERAEHFASIINKDVIALPKFRDRVSGEVKIEKDINILDKLNGKDAIIIDDMISTGNSIVESVNLIKDRCNDIYVTCTHALLLDNAYEKIINSGVKEVISSNTIPNITSKVDVTEIIKDAI